MTRVLVVDDSAFSRVSIGKMLESDSDTRVVGYAIDGEEGLKKIIDLKPDVVTLDLEMPRMGGFGLLRLIMQNYPVPVIVISSQSDRQDVFKALDLGAIDFIAKPARAKSSDLYNIQDDLIAKVASAAQLSGEKIRRRLELKQEAPVEPRFPRRSTDYKSSVLLIGCSTGGPPALHHLLSNLHEKLPVPVVVTQHMPPGFTLSFAQRLNEYSVMDVKEAADGDRLESGRVLICPGNKNIELEETSDDVRVRIVDPPDDQIYTPSTNVLFRSGARIYGAKTLGVVLTGMGNDGAAGVKEIAERGGRVLAEAEESCVVYGMPKEAMLTGLVEKVVPLKKMLQEIEYRCRPFAPVD
ncbi:two-component system, chemotaxis family, response regulator CheB [Malonomonas rubra DSM 5091]|uniref:Protein-glutamate methylesterase/protein-glutamine glutaminase n=1 Tax=Malonomonas rubra DSM 5091 TaxID=1122189 RepID=A0A1M6DFV8_MALRU|nr:chemotaxis response regulator protein-glutamate methylesterase [Malonomonas rubra]SHI71878.1 two-component system, chemotaxis family, response regulator CheB [Malonomonas rubra DSM 5091]